MKITKSRWSNTPKPARITAYVILGVLGVAAMGIVFGFAIMLLWNWLMPELFNLKEITYWQAVGIFILAKFIFGFGMGSGDKSKSDKEDKHSPRFKDEGGYDEWWEKEGKNAFEKYANEQAERG